MRAAAERSSSPMQQVHLPLKFPPMKTLGGNRVGKEGARASEMNVTVVVVDFCYSVLENNVSSGCRSIRVRV